MVAGLDEKSRRMMAEAESRARDRDLTELERELEASFVADLGTDHEEIKTAVLGPGVGAHRADAARLRAGRPAHRASSRPNTPMSRSPIGGDLDSTSKLRGINADSIDLDLDRLANALGTGDTVEQPRAEDEVFSTEVFEGQSAQPPRRSRCGRSTERLGGAHQQAAGDLRDDPHQQDQTPKTSRCRNWSR